MRLIPCEHVSDVLGPDVSFAYEVAPGETVRVEVADCFGGFPRGELAHRRAGPNPVTGPIRIAGVEPGDTIAVEVRDVEVAGQGFLGTPEERLMIDVRAREGKIIYPGDVTLPVRPCIGTVGVCPADGAVDCVRAGQHGGNLDCNVIGPGSKVFFRAQVPGAGLGIGDVHAVMGDGELSGQGLEVPAVVTLRVTVQPGLPVDWPYGVREGMFFVIGAGSSFDEAVNKAEAALIGLLADWLDLSEDMARRLTGMAANARVGWLRSPTPTAWVEVPIQWLPAEAVGRMARALGLGAGEQ